MAASFTFLEENDEYSKSDLERNSCRNRILDVRNNRDFWDKTTKYGMRSNKFTQNTKKLLQTLSS